MKDSVTVHIQKAIWWSAWIPTKAPECFLKINEPTIEALKVSVLCTVNQKRILDNKPLITQRDISYKIGQPPMTHGKI